MGRHLSQDFFNEFKNPTGTFYPFVEMVRMDKTLDMELRGKYVEIYYRGGMLFKIEEGNDKTVQTTPEYLNFSVSGSIGSSLKKICVNNPDLSYAIDNVASYKQAIDFYLGTTKAPDEKEIQQLIVRTNNYMSVSRGTDYYISDIEYALKNARFDMVALYWPSLSQKRRVTAHPRELQLAFIEVKYGDGAVTGIAGIKKHIIDFISFCKQPSDIISSLCDDMTQVLCQKFELGLVPSYTGEKMNVKVTGDDLKLIFVFGDHDPDSTQIADQFDLAVKAAISSGDKAYLDKIEIALSSHMGYGLFALNNGSKRRYLTMNAYIEKYKKDS